MKNYPDLMRRRLLTVLALFPLSLPQFSLAAGAACSSDTHFDVNRIVALEWLPIELLLTLGIIPFGVTEIANYHRWVQQPKLPVSVLDVGSRTEPNMELIQYINPSLILHTTGFGPPVTKMKSIAPIMGFTFNDGSGKPLKLAKQSLYRLATHLGVEDRAMVHLEQYKQRINQSKQRIQVWRDTPLLLFTLLDSNHVLVFGRGSLFQEVMNDLDLENAWIGHTNFWGSATIGIEQLAIVPKAQAIFFSHGNDTLFTQVQKTALWQALPFVRQGKVFIQPGVWFYGATLSAMRFCDLLESAAGVQA
ncbi:Fe(3+)-hydroxamate ABC transporter substrate-binding protein FhuD [Candidatus Fukatsuia symbiotica]|uniref:Iron-hydroxamate transporter substrate-binding subunit n=1 Tax=Candidatus Fukatsuia symbiotica TaxID=1878942 RepID=A0A2U8I3I9_9GAMM|nr:Fe(3+)-hydroxamate ABC transporter substrate-binding protein FhuD [Candidatus Fukatsuia symbiotica]AWK13686.1 iron-hydroxamate transporter substrate-binding subunit [Candidatus Fukatsuia symbiotica]MEA9445516.1 Fe(3+)-hydroxamate ABC transporter substrate-binding protein FhuD [Candidatus Fukatsuia symbiotica]